MRHPSGSGVSLGSCDLASLFPAAGRSDLIGCARTPRNPHRHGFVRRGPAELVVIGKRDKSVRFWVIGGDRPTGDVVGHGSQAGKAQTIAGWNGRFDVDDIAARAKAEGSLAFGPVQMPKQIGYVCFIKDPDGNTIEYSYDQGVYETAREVWGKKAEPV